MRHLFQKLGRFGSIFLITSFSVIASVLLTSIFLYFRPGDIKHDYIILISIFIPLVVAPLASWHLVHLLIITDKLEQQMRELATYDSLTGLLNRQAFFHDSRSFINIAEREQIPLTVLALDFDHFKQINDSFGHAAGDEILKHFGDTVKNTLRKGDIIGRIGGEEFAILLPNTTQDTALGLSRRLHLMLSESIIEHDQISIKYTISIGLISLLPKKSDTIESILKNADKALYQAKEQGRNCTFVFNGKT